MKALHDISAARQPLAEWQARPLRIALTSEAVVWPPDRNRVVRVPVREDFRNWYTADPAPTFQTVEVDVDGLLTRLTGRINRIRAWGSVDDFALRITHAEARALAFVNGLPVGAELRYMGVRLFVDG